MTATGETFPRRRVGLGELDYFGVVAGDRDNQWALWQIYVDGQVHPDQTEEPHYEILEAAHVISPPDVFTSSPEDRAEPCLKLPSLEH
jgi:hypothetical protein